MIPESLLNYDFEVIVVDPPWPMKRAHNHKDVRLGIPKTLDYPTMSLEEIKAVPIGRLAAANSVIFLWTTHFHLPMAFQCLTNWGFMYQRTLTWYKKSGMTLYGFYHCTEFVLFGYRGELTAFKEGPAISTMFVGDSERHSAKPDNFYTMVEPLGEIRIDIFARKRRPGWVTWGNEV